jgi:hypothetical protein
MYVLFFNGKGPVVQILMSLDNLMPEFVKHYNNARPRTGTWGIHLLHDNASAHKSAMVCFVRLQQMTHFLFTRGIWKAMRMDSFKPTTGK